MPLSIAWVAQHAVHTAQHRVPNQILFGYCVGDHKILDDVHGAVLVHGGLGALQAGFCSGRQAGVGVLHGFCMGRDSLVSELLPLDMK